MVEDVLHHTILLVFVLLSCMSYNFTILLIMILLWLFKRGMLSFLASVSFLYTLHHSPSNYYHINFGTCV